MLKPQIEIKWNSAEIEKFAEEKLTTLLISQFWLVDVNKVAELTCMSKRWLEEEIIKDPRMKAIEIKKRSKRYWPAKECFEVIKEITQDW